MKFRRDSFDTDMLNSIRMALLIITVFSLINFAHYYVNLRVFQENMIETTLHRTTNYLSRTLKDVNHTYSYTSRALAELYANKIQQDYNPEDMLLELKAKKNVFAVKTIGLVDTQKNLYLDNFGRILTIDVTSERDKWVQEFLDLPQDYRYHFYDPDDSEYETLYSFYYDHKLKDDKGEVIGILGVGINYNALYNRVQGLDENIDVSFIAKNGQVRLPQDRKGESVFDLFPYISEEQFQATMREDQIIWEPNTSESFLLYLHYLKDINRVLLLKMDFTEYYNQSKKQHFYSFLLGVVLTFIVVVLNLLFSFYQSHKLKHTAYYDSLTLCRNRHYLESQIEKKKHWQRIRQSDCSMVVFDIDHFKAINDTYGHLKGDQVLTQVANIVRTSLRDSDEFIRWGGDEFIVLFDMDAKKAMRIAERIIEHVEQETMVSLSIGITNISPEDSFKSVMDRADCALYEAKENGRNQVRAQWHIAA